MRRSLTLVMALLLLLTQAVSCREDAGMRTEEKKEKKEEKEEKNEKREILKHARERISDPDNPWTHMTRLFFDLQSQLKPKQDATRAAGLSARRSDSSAAQSSFRPSDAGNPSSRANPLVSALYDQVKPGLDAAPAAGLSSRSDPSQGLFLPGNGGYEKREVRGPARERASDPENPWSRMNPLAFALYDQVQPKKDAASPATGPLFSPWGYPAQGPFLPGNVGYPFGDQYPVSPLLTMMYPWQHWPQHGYPWAGDHDSHDLDNGYGLTGDHESDDHDDGYPLTAGDDDDNADHDDHHDNHDDDHFHPQGLYPLGATPPHDDHLPLPGGYPLGAIPHADQDDHDHDHLSGGYASGEVPHVDHDDHGLYPGGYPFGAVPHDDHLSLQGGYPFGAAPYGDHVHLPGGYPFGAAPYGDHFHLPGAYPYGAAPYGDHFHLPGAYPFGAMPYGDHFHLPGGYPFGAVPNNSSLHLLKGYPFGAVPHLLEGYPPGAFPLDDHWHFPGAYPFGAVLHDGYFHPPGGYPFGVVPHDDNTKPPVLRPSIANISNVLEDEKWIKTNLLNTSKTTKEVAEALRAATSVEDLGHRLSLTPQQVNATHGAFQAAQAGQEEPLRQLGMDPAHMLDVKAFLTSLTAAGLQL